MTPTHAPERYAEPTDSDCGNPQGIDYSDVLARRAGQRSRRLGTRGRGLTVDEGRQRLDEAYAMGIKVIDTANSYAGGESERTVGRWLSDTGADVVVTTKVGGRVEPGQHEVSLRADHIGRQLVRSIERLGRVDLYLSHGPDESTSVAETLSAFAAAQQAGLIRAFGCSNVDAAQLEELLRTADRLGIQRPGWVQNGFSLLARQDERICCRWSARKGLVIPRSRRWPAGCCPIATSAVRRRSPAAGSMWPA